MARYRRHSRSGLIIRLLIALVIGVVIGVFIEPVVPSSVRNSYLEVQNSFLDFVQSDDPVAYGHSNTYQVVNSSCKPDYQAADVEEELGELLGFYPYDLFLAVSIRNVGDEPTVKETAQANFVISGEDDAIRKRITIPSLPPGSSYDIVVKGPKVYNHERDGNKIHVTVSGCYLMTSAGELSAPMSSGGLFDSDTRGVEVLR